MVEDGDTVAEALGDFQDVCGQQDGGPAGGEPLEDFPDGGCAGGVDPFERFV